MYRVVVLDNDAAQAQDLREKVLCYLGSDAFEVQAYASADELRAAAGDDVDILVMDIRLAPDEPATLDASERMRRDFLMSAGTRVIYVTGTEDYRVGVYQANNTYFLPKPVQQADLNTALDLAVMRLQRYAERPLRVRVKYAERVLLPRDITYIESKRRILHIHLADEEVETYARLTDMANALPMRFVRCHNSFLANLDYVRELHAEYAILTTGVSIPISRERRPGVRARFFSYVRGNDRDR